MKFMICLGIIVTSYVIYKYKQRGTKLVLVHSNNRISRLFRLINAKFFENFQPTFFLFSGHFQTFYLELINNVFKFLKRLLKLYSFKYEREIFVLSDGGKIAIDKSKPRKKNYYKIKHDRILLIIPGVTSTSESYYVKSAVEDFYLDYDCIVVNTRGLAGLSLTTPLMQSSYRYVDLEEYISHLANENPNKKIFAIGFSYGGHLLVKYLGICANRIPKNFLAGVGICYPCCAKECRDYAEKFFDGLYSKPMCNNIKKVILNNLDVIFDKKFYTEKNMFLYENKEKILNEIKNKWKVYSDFDKEWITYYHELNNVEEYFKVSKLDQYITKINKPFFSLFAEDDPIIPINSVPFKAMQNNPNIVTVISPHGGHLGFFGGIIIPQRTIDQPIKSFFQTIEILYDTKAENTIDSNLC